jgi:hypothetical protein
MRVILLFIGIGVLGIGFWFVYKIWLKTHNSSGEQMSRGTIFDHTEIPIVKRSKYFPNDLYVNRMFKLDPSLKLMFNNVLFGFPVDPLIVSKFAYFEIDGNEFEEVRFNKVGVKDYIILYDSSEKQIYFLNRLMTFAVPSGQDPQMITDDVVILEEAGQKYVYDDFSGLIRVYVTSDDEPGIDRLIRVYQREITPDDNEYCVHIMNKPNVVDIYVGFNIGIVQLEQI